MPKEIIMKRELSLLTAVFLIAGCSSTKTLVYRHPAFDTAKSYRVAVLPFKDTPGVEGSGEAFAGVFEAALLQSGRFEVVERNEIQRVLRERRADPTQEGGPYSGEFEDPVQVGKLLRADLVICGNVTSWSRGRTSGLLDVVLLPSGTAVGASVRAISVEKGIVVWSIDKSISADDEMFIRPDAPVDAVARTLCRRMVASLVRTDRKR